MIAYQDNAVTLYGGDCREALRAVPDGSVHCVVTSPPYWGLRDYGIPPSVWGGDSACQHAWGGGLRRHKGGPHGDGVMLDGGRAVVEAQAAVKDIDAGTYCLRCGAWRGCLGLEPTPALYVDHLVGVFREVRRVLRSDGTCWLVLGDCYASGAGAVGEHPVGGEQGARWRGAGPHKSRHYGEQRPPVGPTTQPNRLPLPGLKPKDLVGIPWRVAFALQDDGWWLRADVIWSKPNPMPESVIDRPTKAHEYVFLLARSERYFYDAEAIKEQGTGRAAGNAGPVKGAGNGNPRFRTREGFEAVADKEWHNRNRRSVWTIATEPFSEAHFATFPPALVAPCVLAGTAERGCCPACGAPWERVLRRSDGPRRVPSGWDTGPGNHRGLVGRYVGKHAATAAHARGRRLLEAVAAARKAGGTHDNPFPSPRTIGWRPGCRCYDERYFTEFPAARRRRKRTQRALSGDWRRRVVCRPGPAGWPTAQSVVLDPFAGAGTTLVVAKELGRCAVGMEVNPSYVRLTARRLRQEMLPFNGAPVR